MASCNLQAEVTPVLSAPLASLLPENRTLPAAPKSDPPHGSAVGSSHPKDRDMRPYHAAGRGDQRALCTTQGSRHAFGCADDRRKEERQHHQDVLRTRESLVLYVQPRKNSKRASPHKNCLQADWSARACAAGRTERNWHEWSSLAASRGLQLGQKKQKKRELTRRKRFSTVTAALFRVLNTLSDPFHAQYVPHGQFESTM